MTRLVIICTALIVIAGAFGNYLRFTEEQPDRPPDFSQIPYEFAPYHGEEHRFSAQSYKILQADTSTLRLYSGGDIDQLWLFVAYFRSQKYGSQIHSPKHCLPGGGWQILLHEPYEMNIPGGTKIVNRLVIADRGQHQLMLYWFETRGGTIQNEFSLKWDLVMNSLLFRPTDAAFVRITLPIRPDGGVAAATRQAERFLEQSYDDISLALPFE